MGTIKVSVVMATYNTGPRIEWTISQLARQTLPPDQFEIVAVDDGSTDDTFGRLHGLAEVHPNLVVDRIPNSGWPGRPRNVGVGLASGEYVFFMDHDDTLFPEALERLYAFAIEAGADVVVPKEVVQGWHTPGWPTWRENVPKAAVDADLLACLTPHKLYRRSYLQEAGIAFPEGRVRLEDFDINAQAYARTDRIAIFSGYPCYTWIIRDDNSHKAGYDVEVYWASFERSLQPIVTELPPGAKQDAMLVRWYRSRILERLNPQMLSYSDRWRGRLRGHFERLLHYFPERLDAQLLPADRPRSVLLRRGDWEGLRTVAALDEGIRPIVRDLTCEWDGGRLVVSCRGHFGGRSDQGQRFRVVGDRVLRVLPPELELGDEVVDVTDDIRKARADLIVRSRVGRVDWNLETTFRLSARDESPSGGPLEFTVSATLDPSTAAWGRPLDGDVWDIVLRVTGLGWSPAVRLPSPRPLSLPAIISGRSMVAYTTLKDTLALDVGGHARNVVDASGPDRKRVSVIDSGTEVAVRWPLENVHVPDGVRSPVDGAVVLGSGDQPAWLVPEANGAALVTFVRVGDEEQQVRTRFGRVVGSHQFTLRRQDGKVVAAAPARRQLTMSAAKSETPAAGTSFLRRHARRIRHAQRVRRLRG